MIPLVNLKRQYNQIRTEVLAAVEEALASTAFIGGPKLKAFEADFARLTGAVFGVGASSGTSALHLALCMLDLKPGDEVLTVPNTFIATAEAIGYTGAAVKFVDIDEKTYNIDPELLRAAITEKTKAVVPVHLYGQPADIEQIEQIARERNIKVVYDAAQAHLATFNGEPLGKFGACVCYSFYPGKNLGAYGDGGMVTTNTQAFAEKMEMLANHGRSTKYEHIYEGYNYRLHEVQAAILGVKLKYIEKWTEQRRAIAARYNELLKDTGCVLPFVDKRARHVYHMYVVRVPHRDEVLAAMAKKEVFGGIHYPLPLHLQPAYKHLGYKEGDFPISESCSRDILSLPMFPEMTEKEVLTVTEVFKEALDMHSSTV